MFRHFLRHFFEPKVEIILEDWLAEKRFVPSSHTFYMFKTSLQRSKLLPDGSFDTDFPITIQESVLIADDQNQTQVDCQTDSWNESVHLNSRFTYMPIGEKYVLVWTRKAPFEHFLYIKQDS